MVISVDKQHNYFSLQLLEEQNSWPRVSARISICQVREWNEAERFSATKGSGFLRRNVQLHLQTYIHSHTHRLVVILLVVCHSLSKRPSSHSHHLPCVARLNRAERKRTGSSSSINIFNQFLIGSSPAEECFMCMCKQVVVVRWGGYNSGFSLVHTGALQPSVIAVVQIQTETHTHMNILRIYLSKHRKQTRNFTPH